MRGNVHPRIVRDCQKHQKLAKIGNIRFVAIALVLQELIDVGVDDALEVGAVLHDIEEHMVEGAIS